MTINELIGRLSALPQGAHVFVATPPDEKGHREYWTLDDEFEYDWSKSNVLVLHPADYMI